jgi:DNA recombination protein RmuC
MSTPEIIIIVLLLCILFIEVIRLLKSQASSSSNDTEALEHLFRDETNKTIQALLKELGEMREKLAKSIGESSKENIKDLSQFKEGLSKDIISHFESMNKRLEEQMDRINKKVEFRLNEGFEKTNKTFTNIVERLAKINEAQKNLDKLSNEVVSLQDLLSDKKARGTFGEVQLNNILESIFGEKNDKIFGTQVKLSNGKMVDAMLYLPDHMGNLAIDSKFPLNNYRRMVDKDLTEAERLTATRAFKADMKKHIDDVANKYIVPVETSEQAVLFVPAEAIFAEINAYHQDVVDYAQGKRVWIASPTTLMSLLTTVQVIVRNAKRDKNIKKIQEELIKLSQEFSRYQERWTKLSKNIETVSKTVKEIHVTSDKIGTKFEKISNVNLELEEPKENE